MHNQKGFTLIEMIVTVIIIGVLAGIIMPNLIRIQNRAKEASLKANMHTLQLAMEDFAVRNGGFYPDTDGSTTPGGETIRDICPGQAYPNNPFTGVITLVSWDADPSGQGEIGINPANTGQYVIKGFGKSAVLALELTSSI